jgi:DNA-binding GntR family transcriptional regulator
LDWRAEKAAARPTRKGMMVKTTPVDIYERLRQLILERYESGDSLSEPGLAKLLQVSRTPVREALARLERDGLIITVPRRGAFVRALGFSDIHEMFEVREAIETHEIRQAAKRIDLRALQALERRMDECYASLSRDSPALERFNTMLPSFRELHDLILATRGNKRFIQIIRNLAGPWSIGRKNLAPDIAEETLKQGYREHKEIIQILKRQDPAAAERAMRKHLRNSRRRYVSAHEP